MGWCWIMLEYDVVVCILVHIGWLAASNSKSACTHMPMHAFSCECDRSRTVFWDRLPRHWWLHVLHSGHLQMGNYGVLRFLWRLLTPFSNRAKTWSFYICTSSNIERKIRVLHSRKFANPYNRKWWEKGLKMESFSWMDSYAQVTFRNTKSKLLQFPNARNNPILPLQPGQTSLHHQTIDLRKPSRISRAT